MRKMENMVLDNLRFLLDYFRGLRIYLHSAAAPASGKNRSKCITVQPGKAGTKYNNFLFNFPEVFLFLIRQSSYHSLQLPNRTVTAALIF